YPSKLVTLAGSVAESRAKVGKHFVQHPRIYRRCRMVIHVDGELQRASAAAGVSFVGEVHINIDSRSLGLMRQMRTLSLRQPTQDQRCAQTSHHFSNRQST